MGDVIPEMAEGHYPGSHGNKNVFTGSRVSFAIAQDPGMTICTQYSILKRKIPIFLLLMRRLLQPSSGLLRLSFCLLRIFFDNISYCSKKPRHGNTIFFL